MNSKYVQEMITKLDELEGNDRSKHPVIIELIKSVGELQQEVVTLKEQLNMIGKEVQ